MLSPQHEELFLTSRVYALYRNSEWHHFDPLGTAQVITNGSAQVVSINVYDVFGVLRHPQGSAQTPWRYGFVGEEWLT